MKTFIRQFHRVADLGLQYLDRVQQLQYHIWDMFLRFATTVPQRRLLSKIEPKFRTFHPPPAKFMGRVGKMSDMHAGHSLTSYSEGSWEDDGKTTSATDTQSSARYCGATPCRHVYIVVHSLEMTRCATSRQCSFSVNDVLQTPIKLTKYLPQVSDVLTSG